MILMIHVHVLLDSSGLFSVKSLDKKLAYPSFLPKVVYTALWKSNSPKRVNVLMWIMLKSILHTSDSLDKKMSSSTVLPSICPLCFEAAESMNHQFFECSYPNNCRIQYFKFVF